MSILNHREVAAVARAITCLSRWVQGAHCIQWAGADVQRTSARTDLVTWSRKFEAVY
jgi:hypothetical protein